jgi:hypothetical protein
MRGLLMLELGEQSSRFLGALAIDLDAHGKHGQDGELGVPAGGVVDPRVFQERLRDGEESRVRRLEDAFELDVGRLGLRRELGHERDPAIAALDETLSILGAATGAVQGFDPSTAC